MTEVTGYDPDTNTIVTHQVLHSAMTNNHKDKTLIERWSEIEHKATKDLEANGIKILAIKTDFISKRRYKRIKAKKMLKAAKQLGYTT